LRRLPRYRGHNHARKFRVWISDQVRRVTAPIRRNYLKGRDGDRWNAVLAAAGYNFSLLLRWLESLLRALMRMLLAAPVPAQNP
jgi:transposase, IS5 family